MDRSIEINRIIESVCQECGILPSDLRRRTKKEDVVYARHIIAYMLWDRRLVSLREIASIVGWRRNSVYYIFKPGIKDRSKYNRKVKEIYSKVEVSLSIVRKTKG